jgi:hypothetical protein
VGAAARGQLDAYNVGPVRRPSTTSDRAAEWLKAGGGELTVERPFGPSFEELGQPRVDSFRGPNLARAYLCGEWEAE